MTANLSSMREWMQNTYCKSNYALHEKAFAIIVRRTLCRQTIMIASVLMLFILLALTTQAAFADTTSDSDKAINVQADQSDFDEKSGIQSLSGNVEITQGSLKVTADRIQIELKNGALFRIVGNGSPIRFQQQTDNGSLMKGQSNRIEYNMQTTQITFSGNAQFERPGQKLSGNSITYNMADLTFKAAGDKKGRVNIILQPTQIKQ